jgi:hypothetical protein
VPQDEQICLRAHEIAAAAAASTTTSRAARIRGDRVRDLNKIQSEPESRGGRVL